MTGDKNGLPRCLVTASTDGWVRFWSMTSVENAHDSSESSQKKLKFKKQLKRKGDPEKLGLTCVDIDEELEYLVVSWENGNFYV